MRYLCSICRMKEDNMNLSVIKQAEKTREPETNKLYLSEYCSTRGCKRKATTTKEY